MKYLLKFYLFKKFEFIYSREQLNRDVKMQPTYEELFAQNQILIRQLKEAQLEIQLLKAEIKDLKDKLNTNSSSSSKSPSQDPSSCA
jgi:hypothetical protein